VAHKPWRAFKAETALRGRPATAESFRQAADAEHHDEHHEEQQQHRQHDGSVTA
jgi:CO/xanthine dehydrogenase FAD-binding subunit